MKKLILIFLLLPFISRGQETIPSGLKSIRSEFYIAPDNSIWQNKGLPYNWHRVPRFTDITDALANFYSKTVSDNRFTPLTRTLSINGVTQDLTGNRSWTISTAAPDSTVFRTVANSFTKAQTNALLSGYTPTSRTLSINGVSQDLSTNRSWTIPTADSTAFRTVANSFTKAETNTRINTVAANYVPLTRKITLNGVVYDLSSDLNIVTGYLTTSTANGTGSATQIVISHTYTGISSSSYVLVQAKNAASANIQYVTIDANNIYINYSVAPVAGTANLSYTIFVKPTF